MGAQLPACDYQELPAVALRGDWALALLDTTFALKSDYEPTDLVELSTYLGEGYAAPGQKLRAEAAAALKELLAAAEEAGVQLAVQSAYRSYAYQESTFAYWVEVDGLEKALKTSARAGHSEHQLGTVVDLRSRFGPPAWELADWALTQEGAWVAEVAHAYGFVMSYPQGRELESCYDYEPWHYRFVGVELASTVFAAGVTLREQLWEISSNEGAQFAMDEEP